MRSGVAKRTLKWPGSFTVKAFKNTFVYRCLTQYLKPCDLFLCNISTWIHEQRAYHSNKRILNDKATLDIIQCATTHFKILSWLPFLYDVIFQFFITSLFSRSSLNQIFQLCCRNYDPDENPVWIRHDEPLPGPEVKAPKGWLQVQQWWSVTCFVCILVSHARIPPSSEEVQHPEQKLLTSEDFTWCCGSQSVRGNRGSTDNSCND